MLRFASCSIFIALILSLTLAKKTFPSKEEFASNHGTKKLTTCEEFLNDSQLKITDLLNLNWKVFYYWNVQFQKVTDDIVKFYLPSNTLLKRLKSMMTPSIPKVEWDKAELHLENMAWGGDNPQEIKETVTALLIRVNDTSGLYRVVPTTTFDFDSVVTTDYFLALKLVDGYLGMMNCQMHIVCALAPLQKIPSTDMLELVADKFNISSFERWPYLYEPKMTTTMRPLPAKANDNFPDDDILLDYDFDPQNMQII